MVSIKMNTCISYSSYRAETKCMAGDVQRVIITQNCTIKRNIAAKIKSFALSTFYHC